MPDWRALGEAHGLTRDQLESAASKLEALDAILRPAFDRLPLELEPAAVFDAAVAESE